MYIVSDFPRDLVLWPKNLSFGKNNLDEWLDKKVQCNKTRNGSARRLWAAFLIIWSEEIPSITPEATVAQFHKSILTKTQYWKKTQLRRRSWHSWREPCEVCHRGFLPSTVFVCFCICIWANSISLYLNQVTQLMEACEPHKGFSPLLTVSQIQYLYSFVFGPSFCICIWA